MAITAASVLNIVAVKLFDPEFIRWSVFELLQDLNDGQREIVFFKPDANTVNASMTLTEKKIKQDLPTDGLFLFDVIDNVVAGRLISIIDKKLLSAAAPTWHAISVIEAIGIKHYSYDEQDPKHFYVYPKPDTSFDINILYSKLPGDVALGAGVTAGISMVIADVTGDIVIAEEYKNVLVDYILFRAFSKDSQYSSAERAKIHYQAFANALGIRTQAEAYSDPNKPKPSVSERG